MITTEASCPCGVMGTGSAPETSLQGGYQEFAGAALLVSVAHPIFDGQTASVR